MKTLIRAFAIAFAITGTFCAGAFAQPCAGPAVAPQAVPGFIPGDAAVEVAQLPVALPSTATSAYQFSDMNPLLVVNTATVDGNNLSLTKSTNDNFPSMAPYVTSVDWTSTRPVYAAIVSWMRFGVPQAEVYLYNGALSDCNLQTAVISNIGERAPMLHVTFVFAPEPVVDGCYQNETAWAAGTRYVSKGNWATYVSYAGSAQSATLLAGQTIPVGTASITPILSDPTKVTITINLTNGALFQNVGSQIKIQDYDSIPPAKNPAPGKFAHKVTVGPGVTNVVLTVPNKPFYGIHLDVKAPVPCD